MEVIMKKLMSTFFITLLAIMVGMVAGCSSGNSPAGVSTSQNASPVRLAFVTQPAGGTAGSALGTQPVVAIQDSNGNTVTDSATPVKLIITAGTGEKGATLLGPSTTNAVNGVARFSDLFIDKAGTGYTITATSGTLASAISASFDVSPGAPSRLVFTKQPSGGIAGAPFDTQPELVVQDNYGNTVPGYEGSVTIGITQGKGPTNAVLSGKTKVPVVNSVAAFSDLSINVAYPQNYTLTAMSGSLSSATSLGFAITAGTPAKLDFTVQPSGAKAGQPFGTQPKVAIEDAFGNVVTSSRAYVTVSITQGTGTAGASLSGTTTLITVDGLGGLVEFSGLSIDKAGSGYTLTATGGNLKPATSQSFNVAAP